MKTFLRLILLMSLLLSSTFAIGYKVVKIRSNDTLSVRTGAGTHFQKIGDLAFNATGIELIRCQETFKKSTWCKVRHPSIPTGWVSKRYISAYRTTQKSHDTLSPKRYRVFRISHYDTLNVRKGAGTHFRKIGELAYDARDITKHQCRNLYNGERWCRVSHYSIPTGWINAKYITSKASYSPPQTPIPHNIARVGEYVCSTFADQQNGWCGYITQILGKSVRIENYKVFCGEENHLGACSTVSNGLCSENRTLFVDGESQSHKNPQNLIVPQNCLD